MGRSTSAALAKALSDASRFTDRSSTIIALDSWALPRESGLRMSFLGRIKSFGQAEFCGD